MCDVPGRVGVQRRGGVNPVTHDQGPERLDNVTAAVKITSKLHRGEVIGDDLTLRRPPLAQEVTKHHAADQLVLSEVAESELEVERPVPHGDQGVPAEHHRGPPPPRLSQLSEEYPRHAGLETLA